MGIHLGGIRVKCKEIFTYTIPYIQYVYQICYVSTVAGQMMWLSDIRHMIFICSPRLSSLSELMEMNVYLADIPLYDVTRELVLLNQQRIAEIDIAYELFIVSTI